VIGYRLTRAGPATTATATPTRATAGHPLLNPAVHPWEPETGEPATPLLRKTTRDTAMAIRSICRFETERDDIVLTSVTGHCLCLRCYKRTTGDTLPMSHLLRRVLSGLLVERDAT
jgi:hypothetical protein